MKRGLILAYHRILPDELAKLRSPLAVSTVQFDKQINYLINKGWRCLTLSEYYYAYLVNHKKPERVFVITFDDGYRDNYYYAFPILKKFDIRATIFLVTDLLTTFKSLYLSDQPIQSDTSDIDYSITLEQLKEMSDYGIEFGSHTLTHPRLDAIGLFEAEREIKESGKHLEHYLNREVKTFCYPYGALNDTVIELVLKSGYLCAVVTPSRFGINETNFTLHRSGIYHSDSLLKFIIKSTKFFNNIRKTRIWFFLKRETTFIRKCNFAK